MDTRTRSMAPAVNWLDPFGSWDAAARWTAIAAEWMAKGWKQWLELSTVWPALEPVKAAGQAVVPAPADEAVVPAQAGTQEARNARAIRAQAHERSRPAARASAKRASTRSSARPQARGRSTRPRG